MLTASATSVPANTTVSDTELIVVPPSGETVTTLQTDVDVSASGYTGDSVSRAEVAFRFQPESARNSDYTDAVFLKIMLKNSTAGLLAECSCFECTTPDCSTTLDVGKQTAGGWGTNSGSVSGVTITQVTYYTAFISWDPTSKIVTYTLSNGGRTVTTATVDLQQGDTVRLAISLPFDVSSASFMSAYLASQVRGGAAGGGDGTMTARFDNVYVGTNGQAATLFDDFSSETSFDSARWIVRGTGAALATN